MKGRLIKKENGEIVFLCADGSIASISNRLLKSILFDFKSIDTLSWQRIGTWKDEITPEMMLYPGETLACVSDMDYLIVYDSSVFSVLLKPDVEHLIAAADYAARHDTNVEYVKVLCRQGRLPGAKKLGNSWVIPESVPYPVSPQHRRKDLEGKAGRPSK